MSEMGRSYEGNPINVVEMTNYKSAIKSAEKKAVLFTGGHHARELSSFTMTLYLMLKTVYGYHIGDSQVKEILDTTTLYFVPIFNVDGFKHICDVYSLTDELIFVRKNRNDGKVDGYRPCKDDEYLGVDLNRNYDYKFGDNSVGSSSHVCSEDYRGPYAFSEPETRALRDFIETFKDTIVMAFNYHAYGNLLIYPFNCDPSSSNDRLFNEFHE